MQELVTIERKSLDQLIETVSHLSGKVDLLLKDRRKRNKTLLKGEGAWITEEEAAHMLGVGEEYLRKKVKDLTWSVESKNRNGRSFQYKLADIEELIKTLVK